MSYRTELTVDLTLPETWYPCACESQIFLVLHADFKPLIEVFLQNKQEKTRHLENRKILETLDAKI